MSAKKEKKKTPIGFLYIVIGCMVAVFAAQMIFPTNLGKVFDNCEENAAEITVTVTKADGENHSYYTDSREIITAFGKWADEQTMRNRSLADNLFASSMDLDEYSFAVQMVDGSYFGMIIDGRGFVSHGAEVYEISKDVEAFLADLETQLKSWEE